MDLHSLALQCAPQIHSSTMVRLVEVESSANPYAVEAIGEPIERQPRTLEEAIATVEKLAAEGYSYSVGLAQVNVANFQHLGLTNENAFDPCRNLAAGASILLDCYRRALQRRQGDPADQYALYDAFSCYNTGNFRLGYDNGYVLRVINASPHIGSAPVERRDRYRNPERSSQMNHHLRPAVDGAKSAIDF